MHYPSKKKYNIYYTGNGLYLWSTVEGIKKTVARRKLTRKKRVKRVSDPATGWQRTIHNARRLRLISSLCIILAILMKQPELIMLSIMLLTFSLVITVEPKATEMEKTP